MQVEKQEEKPQVPKPISASDFKKVCLLLWDNHVRTDLVFGKRLFICMSCIRLAFNADVDCTCDHPKEDIRLVQKFFTELGIISAGHLAEFLWSLTPNMASIPTSYADFMSKKHLPRQLSNSMAVLAPHISNITSKAQALSVQVNEMTRLLKEAQEEKEALKRENDEILQLLLKARTETGVELNRIGRLAHQIVEMCHHSCCCTREENRETAS